MWRPAFATFRANLAFVFLTLVATVLATVFLVVLRTNRIHAHQQIEKNLAQGAVLFEALANRELDQLSIQARLLSSDFGFKQAFGTSSDDPATIGLALENWRTRISAGFVVLVSLEGKVLHDSAQAARSGQPFDLPALLKEATTNERLEARGLAIRDGHLYAVVLVPLLTPEPSAFICMGFAIDDRFASQLGQLSGQTVSFTAKTNAGGSWRLLSSSLESSIREALGQYLAAPGDSGLPLEKSIEVTLNNRPYVTFARALQAFDSQAVVVIQRDLTKELAPYRFLEATLAIIALIALALSAVAVSWTARSISQPLLHLADNARRVEEGDYTMDSQPPLQRADELGQLDRSFRAMTEGLAERDFVRDLLGKVTSPAIAAELTHNRLELGGQDRLVTILFSDLRDFTAMSESMPPKELLDLLNNYFTRMSRIVDAHGGVVDKYIGDALMALFGVPLDQPDQADRALAAALDMQKALAELNQELLAAGSPALRFGIGIHTAEVVAGNIGSPQRYNYTVIGDGVNTASRLQSVTRDPAYAATIIVSQECLTLAQRPWNTRPLGQVTVKGRQQALLVHALEP